MDIAPLGQLHRHKHASCYYQLQGALRGSVQWAQRWGSQESYPFVLLSICLGDLCDALCPLRMPLSYLVRICQVVLHAVYTSAPYVQHERSSTARPHQSAHLREHGTSGQIHAPLAHNAVAGNRSSRGGTHAQSQQILPDGLLQPCAAASAAAASQPLPASDANHRFPSPLPLAQLPVAQHSAGLAGLQHHPKQSRRLD